VSSALTLRLARPIEAGRLAAILTEAAEDHPWRPVLHSAAQDIAHVGQMIDRGWVTVAEHDRPVGFLARAGTEVHALYVARDTRRVGVARALIADAQAATEQLTLWTHAANLPARRLYETCGFARAGRGDGSANDDGLPEIRYRWTKDAP
jgi:GNAT superfamily N-acetyltransferase